MTYMAFDAEGNTAVCRFKIFVSRKFIYYTPSMRWLVWAPINICKNLWIRKNYAERSSSVGSRDFPTFLKSEPGEFGKKAFGPSKLGKLVQSKRIGAPF